MKRYETINPFKAFTDKFENQMREDDDFFGTKTEKRKEISPINSDRAYHQQMEDFMHNSVLSITSLEEVQNEKRPKADGNTTS